MAKILIVVVHGLYSPWREIFLNGQVPTWLIGKNRVQIVHGYGVPVRKLFHRIDHFLYSIRLNKNRFIANGFVHFERIWKRFLPLSSWTPKVINLEPLNSGQAGWQVQMPDLSILQAHKTLSLIERSLRENFDFLVMTTSSSYINIELLESSLEKCTTEEFVGGRFVAIPNSSFPSGSFRVFSKDVAREIVANRKKCCHWIPEDVAIGRLYDRSVKNFAELQSRDLSTLQQLSELSESDLDNTIHFRCKAGPHGKRADIPVMISLHERYEGFYDFQR